MKITSISQNELTQIDNASTLEDLQNLKNLIKSSIVSNDNNENYSNSFVVCILSNDEYDKYIKNSTLNGSILKNNINTWHYSSIPEIIGIKNGLSGLNESNWDRVRYENKNIDPDITIISPYTDRNQIYTYSSINGEYIQNNDLDNIFVKFPHSFLLKVQPVTYITGGGGFLRYGPPVSRNISDTYLNKKNAYEKNETISASQYNDYSYFTQYFTVNFNIKCHFRPVFKYVDNNKSNNVFC